MTRNTFLAAVAGAGLLYTPAYSDESIRAGIYLGISHFSLDKSFEHSLHPNDGYLGPGNQGVTSFDGASSFSAGLELNTKIGFVEPYAYGGLQLLFGSEDRRPAERGNLLVYSKTKTIGGEFGLGARFYPINSKGFFFGPALACNTFSIEHGWERFGEDETEKNEKIFLMGAGATAGYAFDENGKVELGIFKGIGEKSTTFGFRGSFTF